MWGPAKDGLFQGLSLPSVCPGSACLSLSELKVKFRTFKPCRQAAHRHRSQSRGDTRAVCVCPAGGALVLLEESQGP